MSSPRVCAVILTYNRPKLLLDTVASLARQTVPVSDILIVDNASAEDPRPALQALGCTTALHYVRLQRNEGAAGGFHAAMSESLRLDWEWLWLFDDDAQAESDALEILLATPEASEQRTAALCPATIGSNECPQLNHRGFWKGAQVALRPEDFERGHLQVDYASYLGMLIRRGALQAAGLPRREFFIWSDDVEWSLRLAEQGALWLIPESRILHFDNGSAGDYQGGLRGMLAMARKPIENRDLWKYLYGFRNMVWLRKAKGEDGKGFALYLALQLVRVLLFNPDKLKRARLFWRYGMAGRKGDFRTCPPADFLALIERSDALRHIGRHSVAIPPHMPEVAVPLQAL